MINNFFCFNLFSKPLKLYGIRIYLWQKHRNAVISIFVFVCYLCLKYSTQVVDMLQRGCNECKKKLSKRYQDKNVLYEMAERPIKGFIMPLIMFMWKW